MSNEEMKRMLKHEWAQVGVVVISVVSMFLWSLSEARTDRRELRYSIDMVRENTQIQLNAIQSEIKDFHTKLYVLEERYLQLREENRSRG